MARTFSKVGKIDFLIEIQIMKCFDHISGFQINSKQIIKNENLKYVEILILIEQHSNCRLSSAASPVT